MDGYKLGLAIDFRVSFLSVYFGETVNKKTIVYDT